MSETPSPRPDQNKTCERENCRAETARELQDFLAGITENQDIIPGPDGFTIDADPEVWQRLEGMGYEAVWDHPDAPGVYALRNEAHGQTIPFPEGKKGIMITDSGRLNIISQYPEEIRPRTLGGVPIEVSRDTWQRVTQDAFIFSYQEEGAPSSSGFRLPDGTTIDLTDVHKVSIEDDGDHIIFRFDKGNGVFSEMRINPYEPDRPISLIIRNIEEDGAITENTHAFNSGSNYDFVESVLSDHPEWIDHYFDRQEIDLSSLPSLEAMYSTFPDFQDILRNPQTYFIPDGFDMEDTQGTYVTQRGVVITQSVEESTT